MRIPPAAAMRFVRSKFLPALAAVLGAAALPASAGPLAIANSPLFLGGAVEPNLIFAVDDSAEMDFEVELPTNTGAAWWLSGTSGNCAPATSGGSFAGCGTDTVTDQPAAGQLNMNTGGLANATWQEYGYLFPNGCNGAANSDLRRSCDGTYSVYALPPLPGFAWARDYEYNAAYFNPALTYSPWPNGGGLTFANATPTATRYDAVYGPTTTLDLTQDLAGPIPVSPLATCGDSSFGRGSGVWGFRVLSGMVLPAGTCYHVRGGSWTQTTVDTVIGSTGAPAGNESIDIRYFPATFYLKATTALPSGFGYTGPTLVGQGPDGTPLTGYQLQPANFATPAQYTAALQNFANWFTYYRKRHQQLRSGLASAFGNLQNTRVAGFNTNAGSPDVAMQDINQASVRTSLLTQIYQSWTGNGATPNRAAVANILRNLRRTDSAAPVTQSCQVNVGMLFTGGYSDPLAPGDGFDSIGNVDGSQGPPYADSVPNTLADGVMSGYLTPLRSDLTAGMVSVPAACGTPGADPSLDCNRNLHMDFLAATLGAAGFSYNPAAPVNPYLTPVTWPSAQELTPPGTPAAVDDLWHATLNGRGQLMNLNNPLGISTQLTTSLASIARHVSAAGSAALNTGALGATTEVFETKFDSGQWSGDVQAFPVNPDGSFGATASWSAAAQMPAAAARQVFTDNSNGAATVFRWASLDATRQTALTQSDTPAIAAERVDYLRGDHSLEQQNGGSFRNRASALGDIIDSAPVFVGAPAFRYSDTLESAPYSAFQAAEANRVQAVYAGANDGMLHAFRADTGQELFAFVPGAVFSNLYLLSSPQYVHHYYADGTPTVGDAFVNGSWRTVLAAGLNAGGQSVFALDVTQPDAYTETGGSSPLLWEFTDAQDPDLGDTFSRPSIVRMHNGRWAAVFGNGYNNTVADGHASTTGDAVLYVVDLATGALIAKLDTGVGMSQDPTGQNRPNGLATAALVDVDGDGIADFGYAGDLFGNLWKFDFTDSNPANWHIEYSAGSGAAPLYVAQDANGNAQPITTKPAVSRGPNGQGLIVLFGTGKYLEPNDAIVSKLSPQSFYGIIDAMTGTSADIVPGRSALTQQQISAEFSVAENGTNVNVRVTTNNILGNNRGWYLDLISPVAGFQGEMVISDPQLNSGQVIFTTFIPSSDPCSGGGSSWLMTLNLFDGAYLDHTPYDLNGDGQFNQNDYVAGPNGTQVPVSGIQTSVGITPKPALLSGSQSGACDYLIMPGTTGTSQTVCRNPGPRAIGRQSWRQVR